jgi:hypothetical protein
MSPFKTKFTPNYKINWGEKYPKAKYPQRTKEQVHVFDIKAFVKDAKKKKLLEMMNEADNETDDPISEKTRFPSSGFPGGMPGGMFPPFMGGGMNPLGMPRENKPTQMKETGKTTNSNMSIPNPFMSSEHNESPFAPSGGSSVDIDDLVKKIDQKIAELEEEERKEKEAQAKKETRNIENTSKQKEEIDKKETSKEEKIVEAKIEEEKPTNNSFTTTENKENTKPPIYIEDEEDDDDEFFDDFFDN